MSSVLEVRNPKNGELVGTKPLLDGKEIETVIQKANSAKTVWAGTPLYRRAEILYRFCDLMLQNVEDIAVTLTSEMGKPIAQSRDEISGAVVVARGYVERAKHLYGDLLPTENQPGFQNDLIFTRREPLGVIVCVIPFNYPVDLFIQKVAPALVMGNACIVKAPSIAPLAISKLAGLFLQAGMPEDVCQCIACTQADSTKYLISSPDVNAISLTGSTRAGIEMARVGADTLKHIFLELGGNDANIILEDADLDANMDGIIFCRTLNNGQVCCANKRFIIQRSRQAEFVEKLVAGLKGMQVGDPMDPNSYMTCLASEKAAITVENQIKKTLEQGAKLALGGEREQAYIPPTVMWDVSRDMDVAIDMEIFGPTFPIIPFDTEEEAIAIANQTRYGLSSGIITSDLKRALRMAPRIQAGSVVLNGSSSYRHMEQAFGGYKMTGLGREGISTTLEEFSQVKNYIIQGAFDNQGN